MVKQRSIINIRIQLKTARVILIALFLSRCFSVSTLLGADTGDIRHIIRNDNDAVKNIYIGAILDANISFDSTPNIPNAVQKQIIHRECVLA